MWVANYRLLRGQFKQLKIMQFPSIQIMQFPSIQIMQFPSIQIMQFPSIQIMQFPSIQISCEVYHIRDCQGPNELREVVELRRGGSTNLFIEL